MKKLITALLLLGITATYMADSTKKIDQPWYGCYEYITYMTSEHVVVTVIRCTEPPIEYIQR